ncbi:hypothetical protein MD484_g1123, partial [Candolleomyces efflorescens]
MAGSIAIPESPRWLIDVGRNAEGLRVIADLHGGGDPAHPVVQMEYEEIMDKVTEERESGGDRTYAGMWRRYKRRVLLAMSSLAFAQLNGINVISYYAPRVFEEAGWIGRDAILMTGINSVIYLLSTIPTWVLVDRWGRRAILMSGAVVMAMALVATGLWMRVDVAQTPSAVVICVIIFNAAFGYSWGPIPWLYPPEIMPLSVRAKGVSISTATNWAFNYLVGQVTPYLQEHIQWRLYPLHAFFCVSSFILVYFLFPETKGVPLEEMDEIFGEVLEGKDVLLRDKTGSGKSFGLVLALLNKPRLVSKDERRQNKRHITSLVIVPHRELAFQLLHWIERMVNVGEHPPPLSSIAQVLVRDGRMHLGSGLQTLRKESPHVLIGTPQAIMDIYEANPDVLQLDTLSSVVVDEVDYLIETLARKDPSKSFKLAIEKAKRKLLAHPGTTRQLLDVIYARRKEVNARRQDEPGLEIARRRSGLPSSRPMPPSPQLVVSSATLRTHLRNYLYDESGWLDKDNVVKISGTGTKPAGDVQAKDGTGKEDGNAPVEHSVLLVSEQRVRNIPGAAAGSSPGPSLGEEAVNRETGGCKSVNEADDIDPEYSTTPSPYSACMMETVAAAFALDVPSIALLVLPSSAPVQRAVWELRELGVEAHGLDLESGLKGRAYLASASETRLAHPVLLVSTLATTRGLDLPALSHVFIYGLPEKVNGKAVDGYVHIAGRVGRFGRPGKVVSVVESESDESASGDKMARILRAAGVGPVQFAAFA